MQEFPPETSLRAVRAPDRRKPGPIDVKWLHEHHPKIADMRGDVERIQRERVESLRKVGRDA